MPNCYNIEARINATYCANAYRSGNDEDADCHMERLRLILPELSVEEQEGVWAILETIGSGQEVFLAEGLYLSLMMDMHKVGCIKEGKPFSLRDRMVTSGTSSG